MNTIEVSFLQDPILLTAGLVFLATISILLWLLRNGRNGGTAPDLLSEDEDSELTEESKTGLLEARLQEICGQLAEIGKRIAELEKSIADKSAADKTVPGIQLPAADNVKKDIERLETKIDLLIKKSPQESDEGMKSIESKLEGIHKLLISLTDSGSASDQ